VRQSSLDSQKEIRLNREPSWDIEDPRALLLGQLAHYRAATLDKLAGLSSDQLHARVLPSGWTPLELLNHLIYMERRWLQWGFEAQPMTDPNGDTDENDQWRIADHPDRDGVTQDGITQDGVTQDGITLLAELAGQLDAVGQRTEAVAGQADLRVRAQPGGRFGSRQPTLGWILLHVLQEYARHLGQLDAVRELLDGAVGE
jgi:uncharacterized damage-inducible protein DinB